jgi:hypothetical protein
MISKNRQTDEQIMHHHHASFIIKLDKHHQTRQPDEQIMHHHHASLLTQQ